MSEQQTFGRYRALGPLEGATNAFLVADQGTERELWLLPRAPRILERLDRYARLRHPALPELVDRFSTDDDRLAAVFEHTDGVLLARLRRHLEGDADQVPVGAALHIVQRIASALGEAHAAKAADGSLRPFVHGGISESSVAIGWDGAVRLTPGPLIDGGPSENDPALDERALASLLRSLLGEPAAASGVPPVALSEPPPACAVLAEALRSRAELEGRVELQDIMELYRAMWTLWSLRPQGFPSFPPAG